VSAGGEFALASGAEEILNRLVAAMVAVTDQGMDGRVRVQEVVAIGVRTGKTLVVDGFLTPAGAFAQSIGDHGFGASG
jgi:hypothetical protein